MSFISATRSRCALGLTLVAVAVLVSTLANSAAAAQNGSEVRVELVSQPLWHGPADRLNLRVRVTNEGTQALDGFELAVWAGDRVTSRSELHSTFEEPPLTRGAFTVDIGRTLGAGESTTVRINEPVSDLSPIAVSNDGGVFPVTVSYARGLFEAGDFFTTPLIYYPAPPTPPLNVVLVVPVNAVPSRAADGRFVTSDDGVTPLEAAVSDGGWLAGWTEALVETSSRLELGVAFTPRVLEELADMRNGYERSSGAGDPERIEADAATAQAAGDVIDGLRAAVQQKGVQTILTPYSFADLPALADRESAVLEELRIGEEVTETVLDLDVDRAWLFPPAQRVDDATLEDLRNGGVEHLLLSEDSLEPPENPLSAGCPEPSLSLACPVALRDEDVVGYIFDPEVQERFAAVAHPGESRLDLHRLFAETAVVREELPGVGGRTIQVTVPARWHPIPRVARFLLNGFARAPWLRSLTPRSGLRASPDVAQRRIVSRLSAASDQPEDEYYEAIDSARRAAAGFESLEPPNELFERLYRNVLVAQSRSWWADATLRLRGEAYVRDTEEEIEGELAKIGVNPVQELTLTSRRGRVPLILFNETRYPVTVNVELRSRGLAISQGSRDIEETLLPGASKQIKVEVVARASGTFPLAVRLTTPSGTEIQSTESVTVRSTAFNEIALAITFGAFAFLVLFYVVRGVRRKQERKPSAGASAA